ncbi:MAG: hypothetical protein WA144_06500 [Candidatus Methanoperedens sp.]
MDSDRGMTLDFKDEYSTLRQEMLDCFDRIHDSMKYGIGAYIAFISYYYLTPESSFGFLIALTIVQLLVALIGIYLFGLYKTIYRIGTYIAVNIEENSGPRWHRMSRQYPKPKGLKKILYGWGSRARVDAIFLIIFYLGFLETVALKKVDVDILDNIYYVIVPLILLIINILIICQLIWGMRTFIDDECKTWKSYSKGFGTKKIPDKYSKLEENPKGN